MRLGSENPRKRADNLVFEPRRRSSRLRQRNMSGKKQSTNRSGTSRTQKNGFHQRRIKNVLLPSSDIERTYLFSNTLENYIKSLSNKRSAHSLFSQQEEKLGVEHMGQLKRVVENSRHESSDKRVIANPVLKYIISGEGPKPTMDEIMKMAANNGENELALIDIAALFGKEGLDSLNKYLKPRSDVRYLTLEDYQGAFSADSKEAVSRMYNVVTRSLFSANLCDKQHGSCEVIGNFLLSFIAAPNEFTKLQCLALHFHMGFKWDVICVGRLFMKNLSKDIEIDFQKWIDKHLNKTHKSAELKEEEVDVPITLLNKYRQLKIDAAKNKKLDDVGKKCDMQHHLRISLQEYIVEAVAMGDAMLDAVVEDMMQQPFITYQGFWSRAKADVLEDVLVVIRDMGKALSTMNVGKTQLTMTKAIQGWIDSGILDRFQTNVVRRHYVQEVLEQFKPIARRVLEMKHLQLAFLMTGVFTDIFFAVIDDSAKSNARLEAVRNRIEHMKTKSFWEPHLSKLKFSLIDVSASVKDKWIQDMLDLLKGVETDYQTSEIGGNRLHSEKIRIPQREAKSAETAKVDNDATSMCLSVDVDQQDFVLPKKSHEAKLEENGSSSGRSEALSSPGSREFYEAVKKTCEEGSSLISTASTTTSADAASDLRTGSQISEITPNDHMLVKETDEKSIAKVLEVIKKTKEECEANSEMETSMRNYESATTVTVVLASEHEEEHDEDSCMDDLAGWTSKEKNGQDNSTSNAALLVGTKQVISAEFGASSLPPTIASDPILVSQEPDVVNQAPTVVGIAPTCVPQAQIAAECAPLEKVQTPTVVSSEPTNGPLPVVGQDDLKNAVALLMAQRDSLPISDDLKQILARLAIEPTMSDESVAVAQEPAVMEQTVMTEAPVPAVVAEAVITEAPVPAVVAETVTTEAPVPAVVAEAVITEPPVLGEHRSDIDDDAWKEIEPPIASTVEKKKEVRNVACTGWTSGSGDSAVEEESTITFVRTEDAFATCQSDHDGFGCLVDSRSDVSQLPAREYKAKGFGTSSMGGGSYQGGGNRGGRGSGNYRRGSGDFGRGGGRGRGNRN